MFAPKHLFSPDELDLRAERIHIYKPDIAALNQELQPMTAEERIRFFLRYSPNAVITSSFGIQAAVTLHLAVQIKPEIPVIFIDTQYHFDETYAYVKELQEKLHLNLKIYRSPIPKKEQELKFGKPTQDSEESFRRYALLNKIQPLERAFEELQASAWISGIRRSQNWTRAAAPLLDIQDDRLKLHPIADWSDREVTEYMKKHQLINHPLWHEGLRRVGDRITTEHFHEKNDISSKQPIKRECGIHKNFSEFEDAGSGI